MKDAEGDEYARRLSDAIEGDRSLFVGDAVVDAQWAMVEPILDNVTPVYEYAPGTWGPSEADRRVADLGAGVTQFDWKGGDRDRNLFRGLLSRTTLVLEIIFKEKTL